MERAAFTVAKRAFDIVVSSMGLLICAPLLIGVAMAIRLDSPGPVLFRQKRPGLGKRRFCILKFRTMRQDAEARFNNLSVGQLDQFRAHGKVYDDPRITNAGRILRRFSLDELPQLWNVLVGDMTLIGPRPYLGAQLAEIGEDAQAIFGVRPGLTGLWQISGRNDLPFDVRLKLDLYYIENQSFINEAVIFFKTPLVLITGKGAY